MENKQWTIINLLLLLLPIIPLVYFALTTPLATSQEYVWATQSYRPLPFSPILLGFSVAYPVWFAIVTYCLWDKTWQIESKAS